MTRATTKRLHAQLQAQEEADDKLAAKMAAHLSFLDKVERSRIERDAALKAALDEDQAAFLAELRAMKAEITAIVSELRGAPVQIEGEQSKQIAAE